MTDLEAGRELDDCIMTDVFSMVLVGSPDGQYYKCNDADWDKIFQAMLTIHRRGKWPDGVPKFSTDIAAAWLVVEKLGLFVGPSIRGDWMAWLGLMSDETMAFAETMPLAVCQLALKIRKGLPG